MYPREGSEDQFYFLFEIILTWYFEDFFFFFWGKHWYLWSSCLYLISTVTIWEFTHAWIFKFFSMSSGNLTSTLPNEPSPESSCVTDVSRKELGHINKKLLWSWPTDWLASKWVRVRVKYLAGLCFRHYHMCQYLGMFLWTTRSATPANSCIQLAELLQPHVGDKPRFC